MTTGARTDALERLLQQGEGETLEFKQSFDEEAIESVASFANTKGGSVLIGVADNGEVKGVQVGAESLRDWANRIALSVHVHPRISSHRLSGKTVALIEVAESPVKPLPCRGRFFKRVDRSNRQMTDDDLTRLILDKVGATWDDRVESRATTADIDPEQIENFRTLCNRKGRRSIASNLSAEGVLGKMGLLENERPARAAVLLFGKDPQRFYPSASVKIGRFRSPTLIVDDREIGGTLFDQIESTLGYFREHLQTRFERRGTPARDVIWEYPLDALREAVINAVCHRDYLSVAQTQIRWYDERLTIFNPGGLPESLSPAKLKLEHHSEPRNRRIAEALYYAGLIEKWGSGTLEILASCREAGLPEPTFQEETGGLWLTFRPPKAAAPHASAPVTRHVSIHVTIHVRRLLETARKPASREELQKAVGLKNRPHFLTHYLAPLMAQGWLEMTIPDKPRSVKQRYRATAAGLAAMSAKPKGLIKGSKDSPRPGRSKRDKKGTKGT